MDIEIDVVVKGRKVQWVVLVIGMGGKECVHNVVGQTSWDVVSQSTDEDVGDDIDMILSCTSFLSFQHIHICVVPTIKHLTFMEVFVWQNVTSVGISYELQKKETVGEGEISSLHLELLKAFCICVLFTHKRSALRTKMAAWCCRRLGWGFEG